MKDKYIEGKNDRVNEIRETFEKTKLIEYTFETVGILLSEIDRLQDEVEGLKETETAYKILQESITNAFIEMRDRVSYELEIAELTAKLEAAMRTITDLEEDARRFPTMAEFSNLQDDHDRLQSKLALEANRHGATLKKLEESREEQKSLLEAYNTYCSDTLQKKLIEANAELAMANVELEACAVTIYKLTTRWGKTEAALHAEEESVKALSNKLIEVTRNLNKRAEKAEARLHEVYEILKDAGEAVCSRCCPSTWETGSQQLHSELCKRIRGMR